MGCVDKYVDNIRIIHIIDFIGSFPLFKCSMLDRVIRICHPQRKSMVWTSSA